MYTTYPQAKLNKIIKFCQDPDKLSKLSVDELADLLTQKYNVGVEVLTGRLKQHQHTLELWQLNRGNYMRVLCYIELPVSAFRLDSDYEYNKKEGKLICKN
jgi:hypothetical protein